MVVEWAAAVDVAVVVAWVEECKHPGYSKLPHDTFNVVAIENKKGHSPVPFVCSAKQPHREL